MMRNQMREMDSLFDPFGMMGGQGVEDRRNRTPREQMIDDDVPTGSNSRQNRRSTQDRASIAVRDPMASMMEPFGFGFGGSLFGGLMRQMEQMQSRGLNDRNCHVYSQSTVISMKPGRDGRQEIYEATESVRKAGDVKETRRSLRDLGRGVEKMEIGHHIGERGHVIEKRRDQTTGGQVLENQEFIGLKEDDAEKFDREWSRATGRALSGERYFLDDDSEAGPQLAIEGSRSHRRSVNTSPYSRRPLIREQINISINSSIRRREKPKSRTVRVEEPQEDTPKKKASKNGPVIVELE